MSDDKVKTTDSPSPGERFLDWGMTNPKPPTYKHISDNLRAILTIGAYAVLLKYLWDWGDDRLPYWVFRGAAILWGAWIGWFALLTLWQTFHLYLGFVRELLVYFAKPYRKNRIKGVMSTTEEVIFTIVFLPFFCTGMALVAGVFYIAMAMLKSAKLLP
jgi:hypothetical protein